MPGFDPQNSFGDFFKILAIASALGFAIYLYMSILLMIIARKSSTKHSWMAFFPILNLFLMCNIGRRSVGWAFLAMVPLLQLAAFVVLWMSIAEAREKSQFAGALMILPPFTFFVPIYLALGKATNPDAPAAAGPRLCPSCQTPAAPGETFCGNCGMAVPAAAPPTVRKRASLVPMLLAGAALLVLGTVAAGAGVWWMFFREVPYVEPARQDPQPPPAIAAGTMVEFPIDTDPTNPLKPTGMTLTNLQPGNGGNSDPGKSGSGSTATTPMTPPQWLPPGVSLAGLSGSVEAATTVVYCPQSMSNPVGYTSSTPNSPPPTTFPGTTSTVRSPGTDNRPPLTGLPGFPGNPSNPANTPANGSSSAVPPDENVYVTNLVPSSLGIDGRTIASQIAQAAGGSLSGVTVTTPQGNTYTGTRVAGPQVCVWVLTNPRTRTVTLVYSPNPKSAIAAGRLAKNVGNGQGLVDPRRPGFNSLFQAFPARLPNDIRLVSMNTFDPQSLNIESQLNEAIQEAQRQSRQNKVEVPPEVRQLLANLPALLPQRLSVAEYRDSAKHEIHAVVGTFSSVHQAANIHSAVSAMSWISNGKGLTTQNGRALYWDTDRDRLLFIQKGPRVLLIVIPISAGLDSLKNMADSFQL